MPVLALFKKPEDTFPGRNDHESHYASKCTSDTVLHMVLHVIFFNAEQLHSAGGSVTSHEGHYISLGAPTSSISGFSFKMGTQRGRELDYIAQQLGLIL